MCLAIALFLLAIVGSAAGRTIYVDANAPGNNDGTNWGDAYNFLQGALADADLSGDVNEILVAQGIYKPDQNSLYPNGTGDRTAAFQLINGVAVRGGYAGFGEPDPNVRDTELYETILSGDLDGNDADVNEPSDLPSEPTRGENSYHIVTSISSNQTTLLDGFTVTGGNANSDGHWEGAGVYLFNSTAEIMNCSISGNKAFRGGGVLCHGGSPTIIRCTITGNVAGTKNSWDNRGGGILCSGSGPVITECIISENFTLGRWAEGGGTYGCNGPIKNCVITGNFAKDLAGGLCECRGPITNCTISYNVAGRDSGGMAFCDGPIVNCLISGNIAQEEDTGGIGASDDVINCIIVGNSAARDAGGLGSCTYVTNCVISGNRAGRNGGAVRTCYSNGAITNCTITGNFAAGQGAAIHDGRGAINNCVIYGNESGDSSVLSMSSVPSYSCVQGGSPGVGCIDSDPCFIEPGYWGDANDPNIIVEPNEPNAVWIDGDYHLPAVSPCIDAADNSEVPTDVFDLDADGNTAEPLPWDLDGKPRTVDGNSNGNSVVDMGAYEFFVLPIEVSMKLTPQAVNPGSQGRWVKAHFVFPEDFGLEDVDASTPAKIAEPFEPDIEAEYMNVFINEESLVEVEAGFYRAEFCAAAVDGNTVEASVVGSLTSGQQFYGTDTLKITNNALKHLADLSSYWLEESCDQPDWCGGLDLDQNGALDFVDLALFDGCCIETIP
jgi:hypothetical protein